MNAHDAERKLRDVRTGRGGTESHLLIQKIREVKGNISIFFSQLVPPWDFPGTWDHDLGPAGPKTIFWDLIWDYPGTSLGPYARGLT